MSYDEAFVKRLREEPELTRAYEMGYEDGGSSNAADWSCALDEHGGFPEDLSDDEVDYWDPSSVARYVASLHARLAAPPSPEETP